MKLIDKSTEELEQIMGFEYYLETKFDAFRKDKIDFKKIVDAFLDFNKNRELKVVRCFNGVVQEIIEISLEDIKKNLYLFTQEKGIFFDDSEDDVYDYYGFLCEDYFAEILYKVIHMSGKEEFVKDFEKLLKERYIEVHETSKMGVFKPIKTRKLGKNEKCHCNSGKKYKKCCLDKDILETGKFKQVPELWEDNSFAETMSSPDVNLDTFHKGHDEDMNHNCKDCNAVISAHNKDWHAGLCDDCFDKMIDEGEDD